MGRLGMQRFAQRGRPAVPDHWTGRPGGSGAQPPLHLIYMVKVGLNFTPKFADLLNLDQFRQRSIEFIV
jgi:hypothetical protein